MGGEIGVIGCGLSRRLQGTGGGGELTGGVATGGQATTDGAGLGEIDGVGAGTGGFGTGGGV